jgi:deoxyribose-phosphate aldolase
MEENPNHKALKGNRAIDLILLQPEMTLEETLEFSTLAVPLDLGSIYIKPCYLQQAMDASKGLETSIGTVIGFPHGTNAIQTKVAETKYALTAGVHELALALNIGDILSGRIDPIEKEVERISGLIHMNGGISKLLVETDFLNNEQIEATIQSLHQSGVDAFILSTENKTITDILEIVKSIKKTAALTQSLSVIGDVSSMDEIETLVDAGCTSVGIHPQSPVFTSL